MSTDKSTYDISTVREFLRPIQRGLWIVLLAVVLIPISAVAVSLRQQKLYRASADILLSRQNLAVSLGGIQQDYQEAGRIAETQAKLARVPAVAQRALQAVGVTGRTPEELLAHSSVSADPNADLLTFTVTDPQPALAARLATHYADEFTKYRRELDTAALVRAREDLQNQIAQLVASGHEDSRLYVDLVGKERQLRTLEALQTSNSFLVRRADSAEQVQPRPVRNGVLGLVFGLVIGIGLAYLREALDTRVRSAEQISERLRVPMLARLAEPPRRLRTKHRLAMLDEPKGAHAESFRMLRTSLEFANLERTAQSIVITSAAEQEGKSTTAANLAVALARAGRRVVLIDLDLRHPTLARFFGLEGSPGVTDVALGHLDLDEALAKIVISGSDDVAGRSRDGRPPTESLLRVLPAGPVPPDPGEFVGTTVLNNIIDRLRLDTDFILIDTPPAVQVGDALVLCGSADAVLLVARLKVLRRVMLNEVARLLEACPAAKVGFVLTGAEADNGYYGSYYHKEASRVAERERIA